MDPNNQNNPYSPQPQPAQPFNPPQPVGPPQPMVQPLGQPQGFPGSSTPLTGAPQTFQPMQPITPEPFQPMQPIAPQPFQPMQPQQMAQPQPGGPAPYPQQPSMPPQSGYSQPVPAYGGVPSQAGGESNKDYLIAWLLSYFLGFLGVDRFYLGYTGLGIAKLLTLGGCGIWALIDWILIFAGVTKDRNGLPLKDRAKNFKLTVIIFAVFLVLGVGVQILTFALGGK